MIAGGLRQGQALVAQLACRFVIGPGNGDLTQDALRRSRRSRLFVDIRLLQQRMQGFFSKLVFTQAVKRLSQLSLHTLQGRARRDGQCFDIRRHIIRHFNRSFQVYPGFLVSADAISLPGGAFEIMQGARQVARHFVMPGNQPQVFLSAVAGIRFQPGGYLGMVDAPQAQQHRIVSHIAQQGMFKDIFICAVKR